MSWTNWVGNESCAPRRIEAPRNEDEVRRTRCTSASRTPSSTRSSRVTRSCSPLIATSRSVGGPLRRGDHGARARELLLTRRRDAIYPVECFTAGDDAFLSPNVGGPTAVVSVGRAGDRLLAFLADCDAIFRAHGARPHSGKLHFMTRERVDELSPEIDRFREVRRELDGLFLNAHLRPTLTRAERSGSGGRGSRGRRSPSAVRGARSSCRRRLAPQHRSRPRRDS